MYAGYGREANGEQTNQTAIDVNAGTSTYIIANTIDSVGYIGIEANGNNQLVKYNYILNTMQKLNDGGGIYSYSIYPSTSYNNTWRRNIIVNTGANWWEATPSTNTAEYGDANALYLDGYTRKTLVDSNTVINSNRIGIFIQYESDSNTVIANTIYRSGRIWSSNEVLYEVDMTKEQYGGLSFQHNILYPRSGNRSTLFQNIIVKGNFHPFISDYNVMCVPYAAQTYSFRVNDVDNSSAISYTLANWRKYSGLDVNSTGIYRSLPSASDTIFYNPTNHDSTIALGSTFRNLDGTVATSPFILHPYCSVILIHGAVVMPTKLTHHH
jgi:parallel beta-helix repeat protein